MTDRSPTYKQITARVSVAKRAALPAPFTFIAGIAFSGPRRQFTHIGTTKDVDVMSNIKQKYKDEVYIYCGVKRSMPIELIDPAGRCY